MICLFLQRGISAITTPIFTRILSVSDYGVYGSYTSWFEILSIMITLNLFAGVYSQGLVKFEQEQRLFSSSMQMLLFLLCLFWSGIYFLFRPFWNSLFSLTTAQMAAMLLSIWAEACFSLWAAEQRVHYAYRALVIVTLIASVCKPSLSIYLILRYPEQAVTARVWGLALTSVVCYGWTFFYQLLRGKTPFAVSWWRYALMYNIPLIPHFLSRVIMASSDRIMIRQITGSADAGIYDLANSIANIMMLFHTAILTTLNPWIFQKIKEKQTKYIVNVANPAMVIIALVNLVLIALAPELVFIFGPASYQSAIWVIPPIAMSTFFNFLYNLFADFELYYERVHRMAIASVIGALINISLNLLLIPRFGFLAAGYTTLISFMTYSAFHFFFMREICNKELAEKQPYDLRFLFRVMILFVSAGFAFLVSYLFLPLRLILIALFCAGLLIKRRTLMSLAAPFLKRSGTS